MSFSPILRFAVASDVHYCEENVKAAERFKNAMNSIYAYADGEAYKTLDALYVVGDFADRGTPEQMAAFKADCDAYLRPETMLAATLANHELHYGEGEEKAVADFCRIFDMAPDRHEVIKGIHFISMSTTNDGGQWHDSFDDAKRAYLKAELQKAAEDGEDKPIFVFQHPGIKLTTPGARFGNLDAYEILAKHPNVIDFSGHSHQAANDPRETHQRDFTAVGTGGITSIASGFSWLYKHLSREQYNSANFSQMLVVEVDAENTVCIKVLDAVSGKLFDNSKFIYPAKGKAGFEHTENRPAPAITLENTAALKTEAGETTLTFNRAEPVNDVWYYEINLKKANGELFEQINISADFASVDRKALYTCKRADPEGEIASAEVKAVGFFGNESNTVSVKK